MIVGEHDRGWREGGRELVEAINGDGGDAHLRVVRGEGHEAGLTLTFEELRSHLLRGGPSREDGR